MGTMGGISRASSALIIDVVSVFIETSEKELQKLNENIVLTLEAPTEQLLFFLSKIYLILKFRL